MFFRFKASLIKISEKITLHDLKTKLNNSIRILNKSKPVNIEFVHSDVKKEKYLARKAEEDKVPLNSLLEKHGWNKDKAALKSLEKECSKVVSLSKQSKSAFSVSYSVGLK